MGILRTVGLRIMGAIFGTFIDKWALATVGALLVGGVAIIAAQLWPHGNGGTAITQAVTQAVAQRDAIQAEHDNQEAVDYAATQKYLRQLGEWRARAAEADRARADAVIAADDPWLRAKRGRDR